MDKTPPIIEAPATVVPLPANPLDTAENKASQTTVTEDRKLASLQVINKIWEYTQSVIALSVVLTTCIGIFIGRIIEKGVAITAFPPEWWTILGLVIGFYFGRTNHARMGDGSK